MRAILSASVGVLFFFAPLRAQEVGAYFGLGSIHNSSNGAQIDTFSDGNLIKTPTLGGVFATLGFDVLVGKQVGIGAELSWRANEDSYAGIPYRAGFYNVDAIYRPSKLAGKRWFAELRAGIGGTRLGFNSNDDPSCAQVHGCPSSNHLQEHLGVAARWYWNRHVFLRPAFDAYHVGNFHEFGSNFAPQYSFGIGYSLGRGE